MQSSPNGTVKKLKSLDQGSNDINNFLYFLNIESLVKLFFEFVGLLATINNIIYKINLHAIQ